MKSITIQGVKREDLGKVATRNLRNAEQVPCVVYGSGEPIHFSADEKAGLNLYAETTSLEYVYQLLATEQLTNYRVS